MLRFKLSLNQLSKSKINFLKGAQNSPSFYEHAELLGLFCFLTTANHASHKLAHPMRDKYKLHNMAWIILWVSLFSTLEGGSTTLEESYQYRTRAELNKASVLCKGPIGCATATPMMLWCLWESVTDPSGSALTAMVIFTRLGLLLLLGDMGPALHLQTEQTEKGEEHIKH